MKEISDAFRQLHKSLTNMKGNFHILEYRVPIDVQKEYFKLSDRMRSKPRKTINNIDYEQYINILYGAGSTKEEKKEILSTLASSHQVRAYRIIEEYAEQQIDTELAEWAHMALAESRISIESELSDDRQIYISSGLGGKGNKLRFYALMLYKYTPVADYQRSIVEKEFEYALSRNECEIERLNVTDRYVELVFLMPVDIDVRMSRILEEMIKECNVYGDFLSERFFFTNVEEFTSDKINRIIEENDAAVQASR